MHKIRLQFLCYMLISYQNAGETAFEVRGRGTKSAPPVSFLSPCPVVYNFLRQLHTAGLHPLTILAAASKERN